MPNDLCPPDLAKIIVQIYPVSWCDPNNGFCGHVKNSIYDKISKVSHPRNLIIDVGKEILLLESVMITLDHYYKQTNYLSYI